MNVRLPLTVKQGRKAALPSRSSAPPDEDRLKLLDPFDGGFFVLDQQSRFTYVSPRAGELLSQNPGVLVGRVIWEAFPQLVGSDMFTRVRRAVQQKRTGEAVVRWAERQWVRMTAHPCPGGVCVFARAIGATERKRLADAQRSLREQVIAAEEDERERLARDLHDGAGQLITALAIGIRSLEDARMLPQAQRRVRQLRGVVNRVSDELEYLTRGLHPLLLRERGLAAALRDFLPEFSAVRDLPVRFAAGNLDAADLDLTTQMALYRIVQEAVANIAKHAGATRAEVSFRFRAPLLYLTVRDNGRGVATTRQRSTRGMRLGWHTMQERAQSLGGRMQVESAPGEGTVVQVTIPATPRTARKAA